jgi:hypothetical protein
MDSFFPFFLFLLAALAAGFLGYLGWLKEKKRREAFVILAENLGMEYRERDNALSGELEFLDALRQGSNRYAFNVLEGELEGHWMMAFDYHYETHSTDSKGRRQTHHHYFSFFVCHLEGRFPELRVYPESFFSKVGQIFGLQDIDFESVEFSRAFTVKCAEKKFAYDICHPRMMEYLLAHPDLSIEVENFCLAMGMNQRLEPEQVPDCLRQLREIRSLFPQYLFAD